LAREAPEFVSVSSLLERVWPGVIVGPDTLSQRVKLLRAALGDDSKQPKYVAGVRGRGYKLIAPVTPLSVLTAAATATPPAASSGAPSVSVAPKAAPRRLVVAALGAVLAIAGIGGLVRSALIAPPAGPSASQRRPRLAILPLENLSPDPANAFFAAGLQEDLISTLTTSAPGLEVVSRTTMEGYRNSSKSVAAVARELSASHVIEGSVRR